MHPKTFSYTLFDANKSLEYMISAPVKTTYQLLHWIEGGLQANC